MSEIRLCAACNKPFAEASWYDHTCPTPDSAATGTITYEDRMFGLVKRVTRFHAVPPKLSRRVTYRYSHWYEYHGPNSTFLLTIAMLLFGQRSYGSRALVVVNGNEHKWVFYTYKQGLYGLPDWWIST